MLVREKIGSSTGLLNAFRAALADLPGVQVQAGDDRASRRPDSTTAAIDSGVDIFLSTNIKGKPVLLAVQVKSSGYPRDVRDAAHRLRALRAAPSSHGATAIVPLVAARRLSTAARELLRKEKIGYWDAGGSLYLEVPWALYHVDRPAAPPTERRTRNLYQGSSAQMLHALLLEPGKEWHVKELAECAGVAPSTVHQTFTALEAQLWVERRGEGPATVRVLREPGALLDAWAGAHSLENYEIRRYYRWAQEPDALLAAVAGHLEQRGAVHALTGSAGARFVAPFSVDSGRLTMLVQAETDAAGDASPEVTSLARGAGLEPADDGANVAFLVTRQRWPLLFRRRMDGHWVASDVQLYLDLWASPDRGKEQARHLRRERLSF